jgi:hypothetical protein
VVMVEEVMAAAAIEIGPVRMPVGTQKSAIGGKSQLDDKRASRRFDLSGMPVPDRTTFTCPQCRLIAQVVRNSNKNCVSQLNE